MPTVLADTHSTVWYLLEPSHLSANALAALDQAVQEKAGIRVASITLVELRYLVDKGRLSEDAIERLMAAIEAPAADLVLVPLDLTIAYNVGRIPRDAVPDMPDRILAATALTLGVPLVTCDAKLRAANIETIW